MEKYDVSAEVAEDPNPVNWAMQANQIAEDFVYKGKSFLALTLQFEGIEESQRLPEEYVNQGQQIAEKQLVIAGLRLANTLSRLNLAQWMDGEEELRFLA